MAASGSLGFVGGTAAPRLGPRLRGVDGGFVSSPRSFPQTRIPASRVRRARLILAQAAGAAAAGDGSGFAPQPPRTKKWSFRGLVFCFMLFATATPLFVFMLCIHPIVLALEPVRRRAHDYIAMLWMRLTLYSALLFPRVRHRSRLPANSKHAVYVANHNSLVDIFALAALGRPLKYVSKIEIMSVPLVGWAMKFANHIGLKRGNRRAQLETYKAMLKILEAGANLVVFPEGTRSEDGKLRKFQSGAFKVAVKTGLPVVPITIIGTREAMPPEAVVPISAGRKAKPRMELVVGEPIDPAGKTDKEISELAYAAINKELPAPYKR